MLIVSRGRLMLGKFKLHLIFDNKEMVREQWNCSVTWFFTFEDVSWKSCAHTVYEYILQQRESNTVTMGHHLWCASWKDWHDFQTTLAWPLCHASGSWSPVSCCRGLFYSSDTSTCFSLVFPSHHLIIEPCLFMYCQWCALRDYEHC